MIHGGNRIEVSKFKGKVHPITSHEDPEGE
jgi:hypothetical protein